MSNQDIVNEWLQIAYEDYSAAIHLFETMHPKPLEIVCYHCQQSVEKSLKAYLCAKNSDIPKTHELSMLCQLCAESDRKFEGFFDACNEIELYATRTRYPNRIEIDEPCTARTLRQALGIYNFISERISEMFPAKKKK